jgi:hypothetical protein
VKEDGNVGPHEGALIAADAGDLLGNCWISTRCDALSEGQDPAVVTALDEKTYQSHCMLWILMIISLDLESFDRK